MATQLNVMELFGALEFANKIFQTFKAR